MISFFLSPKGRMSRRQWCALALPVMAAWFVLAGVIDILVFGQSFLFGPARAVLGVLLLWPAVVLFSRRLHDLEWSASILVRDALWLAVGPAIGALGGMVTGEGFTIYTIAGTLIFLGASLNWILLIWMLSTRRGQAEANRYGSAPVPT